MIHSMSETELKPTVNKERLLSTFIELVKIDSPSGHEEKVCAYLKERFETLNLETKVDPHGNLIVNIPAAHCSHDDILVLSGHMDVVPPCEGIQPVTQDIDGDILISSDNTTVLGADDKAGLAPIIEALEQILANDLPRPRLRLLLTVLEEVELQGAKKLDDKYIRDCDFSIIFDHTGRQGVIINQAPTYVHFRIEFKGKSVHAGIMPEKGVNAITFASQAIMAFKQAGLLGRVDDDTTSNLGFMKGGKGTNVVPDSIVLDGEIRGHDKAALDQYLNQFQQILADKKHEWHNQGALEADYDWQEEIGFVGYQIDPEHEGVKRVVQSAKDCGLTPEFIRTNGGSDNNVFVLRGLDGVVLSAGYVEPHTLKERVKLSEMVTCCEFILTMLDNFAKQSIKAK